MTGLEFRGREHHSHFMPAPWLDRMTFHGPPGQPVQEVLAALLRHPRYADTYLGAPGDDEPGELHGPYWLSELNPRDFEPVVDEQALSTLAALLSHAGPGGELRTLELLEIAGATLGGASTALRLRELPEQARHDFGHVLTPFVEFVLLGEDGTVVVLVVAED